MEQVSSLTMDTASATPTRTATPAPVVDPPLTEKDGTDAAGPEKLNDTPAIASEAQPDPQAKESVKTTAERAFQAGLDKQNLETEVTQVIGTLNSWWGGVKKQSTSALWSLKADVDKAVSQAQADFEHLRTTNVEVVTKDPLAESAATPGEKEEEGNVSPASTITDIKGKGKEKADPDAGEGNDTSSSSGAGLGGANVLLSNSTSAFFSRLQASTTQIQSTIQSTIASAQASNPGLALKNPAQLRDQIAENLRLSSAAQNLQMSIQQAEKVAEEYMKKGDQWVKDAEKWMGEAVKVVPPEEADRRAAGMSWDGSDWYSFTTSATTPTQGQGEGDEKTASRSASGLAGSRKEALLRRLREDKELLLVDPGAEGETKERRDEFKHWVETKWENVVAEQKEQELGNVGGIRMELVPEHLSDEQFWQRYLFHKNMIEAEEEKRKAVLQASQQAAQDDFSWDDEESETPSVSGQTKTQSPPRPSAEESTTPKAESSETLVPVSHPAPAVPVAVVAAASTGTSPRDSEESYDLVSDQKKSSAAPTEADDEDSDWE